MKKETQASKFEGVVSHHGLTLLLYDAAAKNTAEALADEIALRFRASPDYPNAYAVRQIAAAVFLNWFTDDWKPGARK